MTKKRVSLSVESDDPQTLARAAETMARTAVGLVLDGCETFISMGASYDEEDS